MFSTEEENKEREVGRALGPTDSAQAPSGKHLELWGQDT